MTSMIETRSIVSYMERASESELEVVEKEGEIMSPSGDMQR